MYCQYNDRWRATRERTQTTRSFGSMSLLSKMALSTAEPSLPVALVRASILMLAVSDI